MPRKESSKKASSVGNGTAPAKRSRARPRTVAAAAGAAGSGTEHAWDPQAEHEAIARLAHSYWVARGCHGGSPEEDWFRAEAEIRRQHALQSK